MRPLRLLRIGLLVVCLFGLPIVAFFIGGLLLDAAKRAQDVRSQARFAQLEAMLFMYHEQHGAFPPTKYQPVADGPVHSWRVLLVPYTSPSFIKRYADYDFSQDWNSTTNLQVLSRMPQFVYFSIQNDDGIAHYLAIGDDDNWPAKKPLRSRLITKGKDRFLLVEYPESRIHWMEPKY